MAGILAGIVASVISFHAGIANSYADAQSHLTIARRILDSDHPGLVQLGTVWLPVPHLLLLPFVQSLYLWKTGLAGAILGTICLGVECRSLYAILRIAGLRGKTAAIGVGAYLSNPGLLYLHTTALTEPTLLALMLLGSAGLAKWAVARKVYSGGEMALYCGLPAALAVLSRYDGWAWTAAAACFVTIVVWRRGVGKSTWTRARMAFRQVFYFMIMPAVAMVWWLTFNAVHFGDALSFQRGPYSAQAQQAELARLGVLLTKGSARIAWSTYAWTVQADFGWIFLGLAGVGFLLFALRGRFATRSLMLWVLCVPLPFELLSLYTGQITIQTARTHPPGSFNYRYGVMVAPALACFIAMAVHLIDQEIQTRRQHTNGTLRYSLSAVAIICLVTQFVAFGPNWQQKVSVVAEGNTQIAGAKDEIAVAHWVGQHADGGKILIDEGTNAVLLRVGLDLRDDVASFDGPEFSAALADPAAHVAWVYMNTANPSDRVTKAMRNNPHFIDYFDLAYRDGTVGVWKRVAAEPSADQLHTVDQKAGSR
jgi:hypothetical protein